MTTVNLDKYLPKPLTMKFGEWEIMSPVPNAETGKQLAALTIAMNQAVSALTTGDADKLEDTEIEGIQTEDDINALVLGRNQIDSLLVAGCPPMIISRAGSYALTYWVWGKDAADGTIEALVGSPKAPNREQRRAKKKKSRKP